MKDDNAGLIELYKMMVFEGRAHVAFVEDGSITRYLYHVRLD